LDLLAICDGLAGAETDEVIGADNGICFTGCLTLTVDFLNDGGVQSKGGLRVAVSSIAAVVIAAIVVVATVVIVAAVVVATVVVIAAVVGLVIIATILTVVAAVAAEPVVLTGYKSIRPRDEQGNGELGHGKENEGELKALHVAYAFGTEGKDRGIEVGGK